MARKPSLQKKLAQTCALIESRKFLQVYATKLSVAKTETQSSDDANVILFLR